MAFGRPSVYNPEFCNRAVELMAEGASLTEVAADVGVSRETLRAWCAEHEEFAKAVEEGKALCQAWWEKLGRAGAKGEIQTNSAMWIFNMKNRFRNDWKDKFDNEVSGHVTVSLSEQILASYDNKPRTSTEDS